MLNLVLCNTVAMQPPVSTRRWIESQPHRFVQWRCQPWEFWERASEEFAPLAERIIFIDPDVTIDGSSDLAPWLALPFDLTCCEAEMGDGAWLCPLSFHAALFSVRTAVFSTLPKPWFPPETADDCCCMAFRNHATMHGFSSGHAGWVEHARSATWR